MARKTYGHTDETRRVLSSSEAAIAREMECDPTYIYGIKNQTNPDPFPRFREIFRAAARAGADVSPWLNDLLAIAESVRPDAAACEDLMAFLSTKVKGENASTEEMLRDLADGELDEAEADRLINLFETVKDNAVHGIGMLARVKARLRGEIVNRRDAETPRLRKV